MGTFISTISQDKTLKPSSVFIWSEPLQKIKQYHGMFKYVCDCFVINHEQCIEIFGSLEKAKIWDPQSIGKIDALQIFCGLILFAKGASFKKKLSFLFSIFDFNQIKSLSFIDVEVIILNICNSVYKILNKNGKVNQNQIADWLGTYLPKKQRIKITQLYYFCLQNNDIREFMKCMNDILEQPIVFAEEDTNNQNKEQQSKKQPSIRRKIRRGQSSIKSKQQIKQNIEWHKDLINKIVKVQQNEHRQNDNSLDENNYGCRVSWVYGINTQGQSKPFIPIKKLGQCILYRASSLALIYDLEINQQYIIDGHLEEVSCLAYSPKNQILATVQHCQFPTINLWKRNNVHQQLSKSQKFIKFACINTNHSKGIKLIQFVAKQTLLATVGVRSDSPILIYDFLKLEISHQIILHQNIVSIFNPLILIQKSEVTPSIFDTFFVLSQSSNRIFKVSLKSGNSKKNMEGADNIKCTQEIKMREYYQIESQKKITSAVACYLNLDNPYVHSYKDKSADLVVITGHQSGSIHLMTIGNQQHYRQREVIANLNGPVSCLQITSNILAVAAGTYIYIYDIEVLSQERQVPLFATSLKAEENLELVNYCIKYFDFVGTYILAMTEEGEFLKIQALATLKTSNECSIKKLQNSSVLQGKQKQPQAFRISQVNGLIKFEEMNNIFCILDWKPNQQMILFATNSNKIIAISSKTHEVQDVWEIVPEKVVVALDAVCSDQGIVYIVCACKNGQVYIRIDWTDEPKYYDCGCEIVDAKISKDCSYLLVATSNNYLLFFAQVNSTFTSPRKLLFQYQTPCSINFLDNFKFFLVVTSAKNAYLIQIPQLKHKKLHKQTQKISISKAYIRYPYNSNKKQITYSIGCLGGSMKFSILTMNEKDIYFFNSQDALQRGNYTILNIHKCPVSRIAVNQNQSKFYSLGQYDNTLIEWSVFQTKYKNRKGIICKNQNLLLQSERQNNQYFASLEEFSIYKKQNNQIENQMENKCTNQTYFFKGTKNQKLNESIEKYYDKYLEMLRKKIKNQNNNTKKQQAISQRNQMNEQPSMEDREIFKKRPPNIGLIINEVYGFETQHKHSVFYTNDGLQLMGHTSRFIFRMNIKTNEQIIYEPTNKKISFMIRSSLDGQILYSVVERKPKIYFLCKNSIKTTHQQGIIHMSLYKNFVISFGVAEKTADKQKYSINMHNYHTGVLLHSSFTDIKVCKFIFVNQTLAVSLNEVRLWKNFYPSEPIAIASAGCLLPNNKDILLGLHDGRFAILSDRGAYQLQIQAHEKAIDSIRIKYEDKNDSWNDNFEIVSVGRDEKIKIWTNCFEIKMMISFRYKSNLSFINENNKPYEILETIIAKSVDIHKNKILLAFQTGHLAEVELELIKKQQKQGDDETNKVEHQTSMNIASISQKSFSHMSISNNDQDPSSGLFDMGSRELRHKWNNLYQLHSTKTKQSINRRTFFTINSAYPLIASSACDHQVIIRDYENNQIVAKYHYESIKVQCVKFSPKGNLIAIAFQNGQVRLYEIKVIKDHNDRIQSVMLKSNQKLVLKIKSDGNITNANYKTSITANRQHLKSTFSIINIQFSECSNYFAISFIYQNQLESKSIINIYKTRQSTSIAFTQQSTNEANMQQRKSRQGSENQIIYFNNLSEIIEIDTIQKNQNSYSNSPSTNNSSRYIKSSYFFSFCTESNETNSSQAMNTSHTFSGKNISKLVISNKRQELRKMQKSPIYLVIYEQYIDSNKIRINQDNKVKIKIYQIEDKIIFTQDANINFLKLKFPLFIYARVFRNNDYCMRNYITNFNGYKPFTHNEANDAHNLNQQYRLGENQEKSDTEITITDMVKVGQNLIYGDTNGKIHLVKLNSLLLTDDVILNGEVKSTKNTHTIMSLQRSAMNLSKTYSSHTSFINQMELSSDFQYLFVSGASDDCIAKYKLSLDQESQDLDSLCYPFHFKDIHDEYLTRPKFYDFLNNIDPIREEISDIMLDVEHQKKKNHKATTLEPIHIFGRRAFDKRNNLFEDGRGNLVYSLGPNIIIQNPFEPTKQKYIRADPNQYSNCPQISCMSMSGNILIAATEEQNSRLFIWDIFSITCLFELRLKNFSVVYHIVQSNYHKIVLVYGINNLYEASMQLIDWSEQKVLGSVNMMYSGCWKIKDICQVREKDDGLQFVSCGVQHLVFWEYVAGTLVYSSFGLNNPALNKVTFMTIKTFDDLLVAGCEKGSIYLFKNFQLICEVKLHQGPIRTLALDNMMIFSGGMDGKMCVSNILIDQMERYSVKVLEQYSIRKETKNKNEYEKDKQKQKQKQKEVILAEEDIQSIVLVRPNNSHAFRNQYYISKVYVGTRSGNVLLIKRIPNTESNESKNNANISINQNESSKFISRRNSITSYQAEKINLSDRSRIQQIMWAHDNDTIASVSFDECSPDLFYLITFSGVLQIWSITTLKRIYMHNIGRQCNKIFCFNNSIIICCQKMILTVKADINENRIRYIQEMSADYDGIITDCCMSKNSNKNKASTKATQKNISNKNQTAILVVALKKSEYNEIIVNEISDKIVQKNSSNTFNNLKYEIQFMDFSRDNKYLLFKDSFEQLGMVNLENNSRINTIFVQMDVEWQSQGIRISPYGQKIYCSYSRQNKITVLRRISQNQIIIGDEMGTLRTFQYPSFQQKIGQLHTNCYATHMNFIKNIQIHPTKPYAITTAVYDRSLILWKINRPQEK